MNKSKVWALLLSALWAHIGYTQEEITKEICDQKAEVILQIKNDLKEYPKAVIDQMLEYITPCGEHDISRTSPKAAYAKALLHLQNGDFGLVHRRTSELAPVYMFRARNNGYTPAILDDIINDLSNRYIIPDQRINFNTMAQDLEGLLIQGYKPDVVHYILGYISLKNLTTQQDFTSESLASKAKNHFEKSNLPMAKHWLAIMQYFGYGMPANRTKALEMLNDNNIYNSRVLATSLQNQNNDWIPIAAEERLAVMDNFTNHSMPTNVIGDTKTVFDGHLIEFDWLGKGVKRHIPVQLTIEIDREVTSSTKDISYIFSINDINFSGQASLKTYSWNHGISFSSSSKLELKKMPNLFQDHTDQDELTYTVQQIDLRETTINGQLALIGKLSSSNTKIKELQEFIHAPIRLILYPETSTANNNTTIALANNTANLSLDANFATIAPNPIRDHFTISYTLDITAEVEIAVFDFYGQQKLKAPTQKSEANTKQEVTINSSTLTRGTYLVQMIINGQPYSKTIIKE